MTIHQNHQDPTGAEMVPAGGPGTFARGPATSPDAPVIAPPPAPDAPSAAPQQMASLEAQPVPPEEAQPVPPEEGPPVAVPPEIGPPPEAEGVQVEGVQVAANLPATAKAFFSIVKELSRSTDDLVRKAADRAASGKPLLTDPLVQRDLLEESFDPAAFIREMEEMADPRVGAPTTRAGSPLSSDEGINFKWFEFGADSDPMKAIEIIAKRLPEKAVVPQSKTFEAAKKALAEELDILPNLLEGELKLSARNITAARMLLAKSSASMRKWAEAGRGGDRAALLNFRRQMMIHRGIVMGVRNMRSEAGRAMNALRITVSDIDADPAMMLLNEFGGEKQAEAMAKMYLRLLENKGESVAARFATSSALSKTIDGAMDVFVNGMISNPTTTAKVLFGNMYAFFRGAPDDLVAAVVGRVLPRGANQRRALFASGPIRMYSQIQAFGDGAAAFWRTMKTAQPVDAIGRFDHAMPSSPKALSREAFSAENQDKWYAHALGYFGHIIRANAERGMGSIDAFTRTVLAKGELRVQAYEIADELRRAGIPMDEVLDEVTRILIDPKYSKFGFGPEVEEMIRLRTQRATLTEPLGKGLGLAGQPWRALDQTKWHNKLLTFGGMSMNTFWRVTVGSFRETYRSGPTAILVPSFWKAVGAGGAVRDRAIGQAFAGTLVMASLFDQAMKGNITGAGARGDVLHKLRRQGIDVPPPYSIRMGVDEQGRTVWRSYAGMEPFGGMIAIAATMAEAYNYSEPRGEVFENLVASALFLPFEYMAEMPFSKSLFNLIGFFRSVGNPDASLDTNLKDIGRLTEGLAQLPFNTMVPFSSVKRAAERAVDPVSRVTAAPPTSGTPVPVSPGWAMWEKTWNVFCSQTPGCSKDLPPLRNIWGDVMLIDYSGGTAQFFWPFRKKFSQLDDVEREFVMLSKANDEMPFSRPRAKIGTIKLGPQMHDAFLVTMASMEIRARMREVMAERPYLAAAALGKTADMAKLLEHEYTTIKKRAIKEVFGWDQDKKKYDSNRGARYPEIGDALRNVYERAELGLPTRRMYE